MPTLAKAQLTEPESAWLEVWDEMYRYLCPNRVSILTLLGFYAEHDLPVLEVDAAGKASKTKKQN
jgi:hypothetical protein